MSVAFQEANVLLNPQALTSLTTSALRPMAGALMAGRLMKPCVM